MENKFKEIMPELVRNLGGNDNIVAATHCVSRLRLVIADINKVNLKDIDDLKYVKGTFKTDGQVHVVFGQEVTEAYKEFIAFAGIGSDRLASKEEFKKIANKNQSFIKRLMGHLNEIFIPLIPILVAGGLILALRNIFETQWQGEGSWAIVEIPFFKGLNDFLWIPAAAVFWFLPVFIVWSIFKKMGGSQPLGILIGLSLLVAMPSIYELNDAVKPGDPGTARPVDWQLIVDFFTKAPDQFQFPGWGSFPIKVGYTSQVIPAIGVAFLGVYTERFLNRYITPVLRQICVPLLTILFSFTMAMVVIGPVGFVIGTTISIIISLALTNSIAKYISAPIFGLLYAPLVVTGLHHSLNAVMVQNYSALGGSLFFPILAISNIAQGSACLMYGIIHRKNEKIKQTAFPACTSAWLGVTEPAMYGVNLKQMFPFLAACIGSAAGSTLAIAAGVTSNGIGNGGWLGTITIQPNSAVAGINTWVGTGWTWFLISATLATGVAMALTFVFSKLNWKIFKQNEVETVK